jgi:hypothetical protein
MTVCERCGLEYNADKCVILTDELWNQVSCNKKFKFLCLDCIEEILGRRLVKEDLKPCNMNKIMSYYIIKTITDGEIDVSPEVVKYFRNIFAEERENMDKYYKDKYKKIDTIRKNLKKLKGAENEIK